MADSEGWPAPPEIEEDNVQREPGRPDRERGGEGYDNNNYRHYGVGLVREPTCLCGPSRSVILSEVSEPQELLSLISLPFPVLLPALGEAGGALLAAQTMLWMCSQILLNRRMFPETRGVVS